MADQPNVPDGPKGKAYAQKPVDPQQFFEELMKLMAARDGGREKEEKEKELTQDQKNILEGAKDFKEATAGPVRDQFRKSEELSDKLGDEYNQEPKWATKLSRPRKP